MQSPTQLGRWLIAIAVFGAAAAIPWLFSDERSWGLVLNTTRLVALVWLLSLLPGAVLALLLVRSDLPGRRAMALLLVGLLFVPLYVLVGAWEAGFGLQGWWTMAQPGREPLLAGWNGAVWVHACAAVPWTAVIVGIGMLLAPREHEEEALLDARGPRVFCKVTLRQCAAMLPVAALWVGVMVAGEIAVTDQFQIRTYAEETYTSTAIGAEPGEAPLRALPGIALTSWLAVAAGFVALRMSPGDQESRVGPPLRFALGPWRAGAWLAAAFVIVIIVGVPLFNLAWKAGVLVTQSELGRERSWSVAKCIEITLTAPWRNVREFAWSDGLGAAAATLAVVLAIALAWPARRGGWRQAPVLAVTALCLALPGPVVGLGLIWLFNRPSAAPLVWLYDHSIAAPLLALTIRAFPLAYLIIWRAVDSLPRDVLASAALEGASGWQAVRRLLLPERAGAIAVSWLAALAVAQGDVAASILVTPPGVELLSIRVAGLLHYGVEDDVAGICLAVFLRAFLVAGAAAWLIRRQLNASGVDVGMSRS